MPPPDYQYRISDNGPGFISDAFAQWLAQHGIQHVRGAPAHPQTQGKIERWHQTMKNRILLENYYLPGALEAEIAEFVEQYNHRRYHESLNNLTPADISISAGGRPFCWSASASSAGPSSIAA